MTDEATTEREGRRRMDQYLEQKLTEIDQRFDQQDDRFSTHARILQKLEADAQENARHVDDLRKVVGATRRELALMRRQQLQTQAEVRTLNKQQQRNTARMLIKMNEISERVGDAFKEALKSTPNSTRITLEILMLIATIFLALSAWIHH